MGQTRSLRIGALSVAALTLSIGAASGASSRAAGHPSPTPTPMPQAAVIALNVIRAQRAAHVLQALFPRARVQVEQDANAVVVVAPSDDVQQMRSVIQGIDVRNPQAPATDVITLRFLRAGSIATRLRSLYPRSRIDVTSKITLLIRALPQDMMDLKALVASLDTAPPTPAPNVTSEETVQLAQARPSKVALALVRQIPNLRASVSGASIILRGTPTAIETAKALAEHLDVPAFGSKYTRIYHLRNIEATSVATLLARSFAGVNFSADKDLNAVSAFATAADQDRILSSINELDAGASESSAAGGAAYGDGNVDVITLKSAIPGQQGTTSTTANDIAQAVQQLLGPIASDLHLTPLPQTSQIAIAGSPQSIHLARNLIAKLDVPQPLVALDTEVLEVDENVARNLGMEVPGGYISAVYSEMPPTPNPSTNMPGQWGRLQAFTRTGISFTALLNFLIQKGNGRVLADPRVTTVSGRPANITAGDQINVLTQAGGGITPITQSVQSFQTGVSLDITPIVNDDGSVTVSLHPRVSSVADIGAGGIPNIAQREATTVVQMQDNETLVIGGLIQEVDSHVVSKIPLLGDIPLIGRLFQNYNVSSTRNDLIIAITPHVLKRSTGTAPAVVPTPSTLPTAAALDEFQQPAQSNNTFTPGRALATPSPVPRSSAPLQPLGPPLPSTDPANVFTYGSPPPNTFVSDSDAPRLFYAQLSPTIVHEGTQITVFALTSSNVKRVTIGLPGRETSLTQTGPSKWQVSYPFSSFGVQSNPVVNLVLSAYGASGSAATTQIPIRIANSP